jgi:signal transduction histidine kinase
LDQDFPPGPERALILTRLGVIQADLGNQVQALSDYKEAIQIGDVLNVGIAQYRLAELFNILNQPDSSLHNARLAFISTQKSFQKQWQLEASNLLVKLYKEKNNIDSAFHYQEISKTLNDSIFGPEKFHRLQLLAINEQQEQQKIMQRQKEIQEEKERFENKIKLFALLATVVVFLILAIILYRNNRQKQKTNNVLEETLSELKSTQSQLIQSEKMASLGELTAGIAHEIQNPLNFVNNFSEVNKELIDELKSELAVGNTQSAGAIADDIKDNQEKINHHGKRADAIVKGMLQHSRSSSGQKELTGISVLCDEYLRLAYHGLRAKDKSFNAEIKTDFDNSIGKINIVPQEIGRVILNLINNAFYAVREREKLQAAGYKPQVTVQTRKLGDKLEIIVEDNGNGIPKNIVDKIFQPFFTTKPTGQGTGLGLSLAYDIIKAHGGEIKVKTKEGEGSEFTIKLPG